MLKKNTFLIVLISLLSSSLMAQMAPFTKGNFVVLRLQNPAGSAGGIIMQEYSPTGTRVQQMSFDTLSAPNNRIASPSMGTGETEYNYLSLSANGQYVTFGGFTPPTSGNIVVPGNTRVGALIKYDGTVNTQTTFTGSSYQFLTASAASTASTSLTLNANPNYNGAQAGAASNATTGSTTLTLSAANVNFANGNYVYGPGIPEGATIVSGGGTTTLTLSANTIGTNSGSTYYSSASLYKISGAGIPANTNITAYNTVTRVATLSQPATVANATALTVELVSPTTNFTPKSFVTLDGTGIWASYSGLSGTANGILYQPTGSTGTPISILASSTGNSFRQMNISPYDGNLYVSRNNSAYNYFSGVPIVTQPSASNPPNVTTGATTTSNRGYCFVQPIAGGGEVMYVASVAAFSQAGAVTASTTIGSNVLTLSAINANFKNGNYISGAGIPAGTTIVSGEGSASLSLSNNATATLNGQNFYTSVPTLFGISKFYRTSPGSAWTAAGGFGTSAENYLTVTAEPKIGGGFTIYATKFSPTGNVISPTTYTQAGSSTLAGSNIVTLGALNSNFAVGNFIAGTGIPTNTTITAINGASVTISNNATLDGTNVTLTTGTLAGSPCIVKIDDAADFNANLSGTETVIVNPQFQQVFRGISIVPMATPILVPLKLTNFSGKLNGANVQLNWTSIEEKNVAFFEIESSINGTDFNSIGKVAATNKVEINEYAFLDPKALAVITFYRLKMVDKDGSISYSKILSFSPEKKIESLKIYPNPASNTLYVSFSPVSESANITVYDVAGKLVLQKVLSKSSTSLQLDINFLNTGSYLLKLTDSYNVINRTFIKN